MTEPSTSNLPPAGMAKAGLASTAIPLFAWVWRGDSPALPLIWLQGASAVRRRSGYIIAHRTIPTGTTMLPATISLEPLPARACAWMGLYD